MRKKDDFYPTSAALTESLLAHVPIRGHVLEPCAGDGAIVRVLRRHNLAVNTCDINPEHQPDHVLDMTQLGNWRLFPRGIDWVITNPPFAAAAQILPSAFAFAEVGVAFLLRLSYLEPAGNRANWLQDKADSMTNLLVFGSPRPGFRHGEMNPKTGKPYTTDNVTVAWFIWRRHHSWKALGVQPPFSFVTHWNGG